MSEEKNIPIENEATEEIKEEALPAELLFGDDKKDTEDGEADSADESDEIFEVTDDSAEAEDTKKDEQDNDVLVEH